MGMSATQARLIQLTARMSDTEYEAQQINQQRLTLSNKMNEVYEMMCNMEVPTPPSKIDYMTPVYRGKQGGTDMQASINDDGSVSLKVQASGDVVQNAGNKQLTVNNDPAQFIDTASSFSKGDFEVWDAKDYTEIVTKDNKVNKPWTEDEGWDHDDHEYVTGTYSLKQTFSVTNMSEEERNALVSSGDVSYNLGGLTENTTDVNGKKVKTYSGSYSKTVTFRVETPTDRTAVETEASQKYQNAEVAYNLNTEYCEGTRKATKFSEGFTYKLGNNGDPIKYDDIKKHNDTAQDLQGKKFVVDKGNGDYELKDWSQISETDTAYVCTNVSGFTDAIEAKKNGTAGMLVGGSPTMSITEANTPKNYRGIKAFDDALAGLQNTFPDNWQEFSVIVQKDADGNPTSFSFCMTSDLEQSGNTDKMVTVYTPGKGTYWKPEGNVDPNNVTWDSNGNIASVNGVSMETEQVVDEYAYEAAMNQYSSEKAVYDKEQNELNKKTSIYQRQDKQLELKLTRLDSERNALNTEIEAVKKVIQDAVDRGFKTFSG